MARKKEKDWDKVFAGAEKMPPLYHKVPGEDFDIARSEVCDFLCSLPGVRQWIYDTACVQKKAPLVFTKLSNGSGIWYGDSAAPGSGR